MNSASKELISSRIEVDVWLEVGREGRCFSYLDGLDLGVGLGDLVLVKLRGRSMKGLVVKRRILPIDNQNKDNSNDFKLSNVEGVVQHAAVDSQWRDWIEKIATNYHTSSFKMLKAALPPGWLGQGKQSISAGRLLWKVYLQPKADTQKKLSFKQKALEEYLLNHGGESWQKDLQDQGFSSVIIKGLVSKKRAFRERRLLKNEIKSESKNNENISNKNKPLLTDEQKQAIQSFLALKKGSTLLLWGITGSGKTEVYLRLAEIELKAGRNCLILAPEIGLIPQLFDRCKSRFGVNVFQYHSGCIDSERIQTWRQVIKGSHPIVVVGTRSAIFLPLNPLGLIVLDEEHDSSYKQESPMPCYHARDLALSRAKWQGAKVLLGSATPSLFVWKSLSSKGSIMLSRLTRRISGKALPKVHVIDMRLELEEGHRRLISRALMNDLRELTQRSEQAVILVPRRGYSSFLSCRSCGEVVNCPNCDVALTVHRNKEGLGWLRCHWCDFRTQIHSTCNECGSRAFKPFGAGTQRVLDYLENELEGLRLLRFDRDTTGGKDGHRKLLEKFAKGDADVLVGTQMLAKGMDLPRVTLAAVIAADGLLHRPDLLAGEQSLQLFMQLAGRAGRGELPGKVVVQTYCPNHPVVLHLVDGRYEEFLKLESKMRKEAGLIPYSRACLIRFSGESSSLTASTASSVAEFLKPFCYQQRWSLIGPAPSLITRVAGKTRWQLLLHGPENTSIPIPSGSMIWDKIPKGVSLAIDPDPLQL